ncbi:MAG: HAD hydrolase-like protein [Ardenticatenaceae bacterium]|nr:HAD hydrolase-like protein [Ardenticatenaceae bacterium]
MTTRKHFGIIALDADDTLWQNETLYHATQEKFRRLLANYAAPEVVNQTLYETEMGNLRHFGYGIKSFTLSMLETAVTLANGHLTGQDVKTIINFAKEMVNSPTKLLEHVAEIVPQLAQTHQLMLLTKGDLLDQEAKLARSGLADYFDYVEVVSNKTSETYAAILGKYRLRPEQFLMVGNSLKSDVLPVVAVGGTAVYIPYHLTWAHETVTNPTHQNYLELDHIGQLPDLIKTLESGS